MTQPREIRDSYSCMRLRDAALAFILIARLAFRYCEQWSI